ncbi:energy transducer TonB [Flavobacterium olei]|uniref:energy transducer TonB n=1 Tax=Flavobacterium olei TaxID=1886782 RepID=UPI00321B2FE2
MRKFLILILICFAQISFSQNTKTNSKKKSSTKESQAATVNPGSIGNTDSKITIDEPITKSYPQGDEPNDDYSIYNTAGIELKPEFPGGIEAMNDFIKQNFKSPKVGLKGKIYATFIIEKDGSLSDIKILRDLGHQTGAEAIRVLKLFPKWSPGKQDNKLVRVLYSIPMVIN